MSNDDPADDERSSGPLFAPAASILARAAASGQRYIGERAESAYLVCHMEI